MADSTKDALKALKENESTVSLILGVVVVLIVGLLLFNYFKSNRVTPEITEESESIELTSEDGTVNYEAEDGLAVPKNLPAEHEVVAGESLWQIAEKYYASGYNWTDIAKENNLANANAIDAGMKLAIPRMAVLLADGSRKSVASDSAVKSEEVAEPTTMAEVSPTAEPTQTEVAETEPTVTPEPVAEAPAGEKGSEVSAGGRSYVVQRGDFLWNIAVKEYNDGYKWVEIYRANQDKISNPGLIHAGLELRLP